MKIAAVTSTAKLTHWSMAYMVSPRKKSELSRILVISSGHGIQVVLLTGHSVGLRIL